MTAKACLPRRRMAGSGEGARTALEAARQLAARLHLTVHGQLAGGEFGAFAVTDARGRAGVLKLLPHNPGFTVERVSRAVEVSRRLKAAGYPVPAYWDVGSVDGHVYSLQEACGGAVPDTLSLEQAQRMLELWRLHAGAARGGGMWAAYAVRTLREGPPGGLIDHGAVRAACGRAADLIEEIAAVGGRTDPAIFREGDIVHGDFHHRNQLVDAAGQLTAIFDWEGADPGDCRLDLATLAFWTQATEQLCAAWVKARAREEIEPEAGAALAALIAGGALTFALGARPGYMDWAIAAVDRVLRPLWQERL